MGGKGSGRKKLVPDQPDIVPAVDLNLLPEYMNGKPVWERMEGESSEQFAAFQVYRDLNPMTRSVAETWRLLRELRQEALNIKRRARGLPDRAFRPKAYNSRLEIWSREWSWVDRAERYDEFLDRQRIASRVKEVMDMSNRHITMAGLLQNKAVKRLKEMTDGELTPRLVLEYISESIKIERGARGEIPEFFKQKHIEEGRHRPVTDGPEEAATDQAKQEILRRLDQIAKRKAEQAKQQHAAEDADTANAQPERKIGLVV